MFTRPTLIRESVYDHLRNAILNGEFQPAERLGEMELTERLGVSRTPIREAIGRLTQDGLLEGTPGRGVRIRVVSAPRGWKPPCVSWKRPAARTTVNRPAST